MDALIQASYLVLADSEVRTYEVTVAGTVIGADWGKQIHGKFLIQEKDMYTPLLKNWKTETVGLTSKEYVTSSKFGLCSKYLQLKMIT